MADVERIHSQVIFWIFTVCHAFDMEKKSDLITGLFNLPAKKYFRFECVTEDNNIDIQIEAYSVEDNDLFVIENKLKSSQHSGQLQRYRNFIETDNSGYYQSFASKYYGYLTLIDEELHDIQWRRIKYRKLCDLLKKCISDYNQSVDTVILREYIHSLKNLVFTTDDFLTNHKNYRHVFIDGNKSKHQKRLALRNEEYNENERFICENQLETILQKAFLTKVLHDLNIDYEYDISETHGTAVLQISFPQIVKYNNIDFHYGIQFQGSAVKINFSAVDYSHSNPDLIPPKVERQFKDLQKEIGYKFNKPRNKAYLSLSKTLTKDIWETEYKGLVKLYKHELEFAEKVVFH